MGKKRNRGGITGIQKTPEPNILRVHAPMVLLSSFLFSQKHEISDLYLSHSFCIPLLWHQGKYMASKKTGFGITSPAILIPVSVKYLTPSEIEAPLLKKCVLELAVVIRILLRRT